MNSEATSSTPAKTRRDARISAMQVIYAYEISQEPVEMLVESIAAEELADAPEMFTFMQGLVYAVLRHREEVDGMIRAKAEHWDFERIALLDRILMRMGLVEFLYYDDIPTKVSVNECVEIAKLYSTDQSSGFINGMLDALRRELQEAGRITKSGRGLIDSSARGGQA